MSAVTYKRSRLVPHGSVGYFVYLGREHVGMVSRERRADEAVDGKGPTFTTWVARSRYANASGVGRTRDEAVALMIKCEQGLPA